MEPEKKKTYDCANGYFCFVAFVPFLIWVPQMLALQDMAFRKKYVSCVPCPWEKRDRRAQLIPTQKCQQERELLRLSHGDFPEGLLCFILLFLPACHQSCFRCAGKSPHNCTACRPSHVLLDGQCLSRCPDSYFNQEGRCSGKWVTCWGRFPVLSWCLGQQPDSVIKNVVIPGDQGWAVNPHLECVRGGVRGTSEVLLFQ